MNNKFMRTKFGLILVIFIVLLLQARANFAQTVDERITRSLAAINKNDFDGAMTDLNEIFKIEPNNTTALYLRGIINYKQNKFDQAIADQTKAIELNKNPNFVEFYYERGLAYQDKPNPDHKSAVADFSHAIEIVPTYRNAYDARGWSNFRLQNWAAAAADYTQAIKYGAANKEVYINRGAASLNAGDYAQAVADNRKALEMDPNNATALKNLDLALAALKQNPAQPEAGGLSAAELLKRAADAKKSGDTAAQEKYLTAAIRADPKNYDAYEQRALVYDLLGKKDLALADSQQMIDLDPGNLDGYFLQASFYKDKKDYARAIPDYTSLLKLNLTTGQSAQTYYQRGVAYRKIHEYDKALADLSKALELQPDYKSALAERGEIYTFQGNYEPAEADLKKLLKLDPANELAGEYTELIKTAKKTGFNTGQTKEDTLFNFNEYSDEIIAETEVYTKKMNAETSAIVSNPKDTAQICSLLADTDQSLKKIEANVVKVNQMMGDGKLDKLPAVKTAAGQLTTLFPDDRATINKDAAKYGCKLN